MLIKYTLNNNNNSDFIKLPINLTAQPTGQEDDINNQFVNTEIDKSVNDIIDYEKIRLTPVDSKDNKLSRITVNLTFNGGGNHYGAIGFTNDDIIYRKNSYTYSFLRFNFYDSDKSSNQNLITTFTSFCNITPNDIITPEQDPVLAGTSKPVNELPTTFNLIDPTTNNYGNNEGYFLYNFKDINYSSPNLPYYLYARVEFNNAKTGKTTLFTPQTNLPTTIESLLKNIHIRYLLTKGDNDYYYKIDTSYNKDSTNIKLIDSTSTEPGYMIINLKEIAVL